MTIRSRGALALGILFFVGTSVVLMSDVRSPADFTTDHLLTLGTLVGTVAAGHFWWPTVKDKNVLAALGLTLAFAAGTFMCVAGSAGRGGEAIQRKTATAAAVNEKRADAIAELKKARARRDELATQLAKECGSGKGARCKGLREALDAADSHVAILQVRADEAPAEEVANVKLKKAAEVIAFFSRADRQSVEQGLELMWPFANALIWELLTITFLSLGLGHGARREAAQGISKGVVVAAPMKKAGSSNYQRWKERQLEEMKAAGVTCSLKEWHELKMGRQSRKALPAPAKTPRLISSR